jgi:uncharacterized protein
MCALELRPLIVAAVLALTVPLRAAAPEIPLTLPSGKVLSVELMLTGEDRARGLMGRPSLPSDHGLLFVFEAPGSYPFWMKNCRFPIDIVWMDEEGRVVYVAASVPPCRRDPCPTYQPGGPSRPARFVLEIGAGQAEREGVRRGSKLDFKLAR